MPNLSKISRFLIANDFHNSLNQVMTRDSMFYFNAVMQLKFGRHRHQVQNGQWVSPCYLKLWQYWLWSFKFGDTKSDRFLDKNQSCWRGSSRICTLIYQFTKYRSSMETVLFVKSWKIFIDSALILLLCNQNLNSFLLWWGNYSRPKLFAEYSTYMPIFCRPNNIPF